MKNYWFLLLLMGGLFMVACGDDDEGGHGHDDEYDATVQIMSPAQGDTVTVGEVAHIHVDFTRPDSKIVHNVKVEVLDANGDVVNTLVDEHAHEEGIYSFHSNDFTPAGHGAYTLRATTTNDAGESPIMEEVTFMAMHAHTGGDYKVTIDIVSPAADAIATINQAMAVEVNYTHDTHGSIIHNIMIDIIDSESNSVGTLFEMHVHSDVPYTYKEDSAWTPDKAGDYTLRAMTTDDAGENMNMMMRPFKVQ